MNNNQLVFNYKGSIEKQKRFLYFHLFIKDRVMIKVLLVILLLFGGGIFALAFHKYMTAVGGFIVAFVMLAFFIIKSIGYVRRNQVKSGYFPELIISFGESTMSVENIETGEKITKRLDDIECVYRYKKHIFVYVDVHQALCLNENELSCGDIHNYFKNNVFIKNKYFTDRRMHNDN